MPFNTSDPLPLRSARRTTALTLVALTGLTAHALEPVPGRGGAQPANIPASQPTPDENLTVQVEPTPDPTRHHDPAATALLDQAEKAIADLNTFRTTLKVDGTQVFSGTTDEGQAGIIAMRSPDNPEKWLVRITGPITPERATTPLNIDASFNGSRMRWLDHDDRSMGARELPIRMNEPWFAVPDRLRAKLWISPNPFASERAAETLTLEARETIDGVECEVIRADMAGGTSYYRLFLGVDDHLPRRAVRGFDSRGGALPMVGTEVVEYLSLTSDVDLATSDFTLPKPEGYRIEQFPDEMPAIRPPVSPDNAAQAATHAEEGTEAENGDADGDGDTGDGGTTRTTTTASNNSAATAAAGALAPDFDLKDSQGQSVRLGALRGQPVVLFFWGSWNPWATKLARELRAIREENPDLKILVLAIRERTPEKSRTAFAALSLTATLLPSADDAAAAYEIAAVPTLVLVDANGRVALRHAGFNSTSSPLPALREALAMP